MHTRRFLCAFALVFMSFSATFAQQALPASPPVPGSNWQSVRALPANTKVHVSTDHGGRTCRIFAVGDDSLTCANGSNAGGAVLQRGEIRHIKLAHYLRSSLTGAGIGGGIGAISGAIAGKSKPCPTGQGFCLNGIGIGAGGVAAIFGVGGALVGSIAGGATDMTRGSSIYTRP